MSRGLKVILNDPTFDDRKEKITLLIQKRWFV